MKTWVYPSSTIFAPAEVFPDKETSDVELKKTFAWLMSTRTFYIAMAICLVILQTRTQILSKYR
jgi:hypothetical protein